MTSLQEHAPPPLENTPPSPLPRQADKELHRELSRIAVLHEVPDEVAVLGKLNTSAHLFDDNLEAVPASRVEVAQHGSGRKRLPFPFMRDTMEAPGWATDPISQEKSDMVKTVHSMIRSEARATDKRVDWLQTADALLAKAETTDEAKARHNLLVSAVASAQFSSEPGGKADFLKKIYDHNLQLDTAAACALSHVVILNTRVPKARQHIGVDHIKDFAPAFMLPRESFDQYLETIRENRVVSARELSARKQAKEAQKRLTDAYVTGNEPDAELVAGAEAAVLSGEKIKGTLFDVHKVERFALQQYYIKEQMQAVLGDDVRNTPLKRSLAASRHVDNVVTEVDFGGLAAPESNFEIDLEKFNIDVADVVESLSKPVTERFETKGTEEYKATERFRDLIRRGKGHVNIGRFVDKKEFLKRKNSEVIMRQMANREINVWTASQKGGAAVEVGTSLIELVMEGALFQSPEAGPIQEDEVRDFLQSNRLKLLQLATQHVADLNGGERMKVPTFVRDENNQLTLAEGLRVPAKDKLDVYSAIALGCPALRETHDMKGEMRKAEDRLSHGSANYIDHLLAVMINEAYDRGLLDVQKYKEHYQTPQQAA